MPGVTVYGYLAAAVHQHFGSEWLERGAMDVRFQKPVYDGDDVTVLVHQHDASRISVTAGECALAAAWIHRDELTTLSDDAPLVRKIPSVQTYWRIGTALGTWTERLDLAKMGVTAPLDPVLEGRAHPAVMLGLANKIFVENYELGPWMHVASEVRKFGSAKDGDEIRVRATAWRIDLSVRAHEFRGARRGDFERRPEPLSASAIRQSGVSGVTQ